MEKSLKQAMLAECVLFSQPNQSFPNCGALRFFWSNPFFSVSPNNVLWSKDFLMLFWIFVIYSSIMVTPRTVVGHIIDTQVLTLTIMPVLVSPLHWIVNLTMHVVRKKTNKKNKQTSCKHGENMQLFTDRPGVEPANQWSSYCKAELEPILHPLVYNWRF